MSTSLTDSAGMHRAASPPAAAEKAERRKPSSHLKSSKYNWLVERNHSTFIYNGLTGALAKIDEKNETEIRQIIGSCYPIPDTIDESILACLLRGGYLIEQEFDEVAYLEVLYNLGTYGNQGSHFTVTVTHECNLACRYCYQNRNRRTGPIRDEVIDAIASSLEVAGGGSAITLYGGEPMLYPEVCLDICRKCMDAADKSGKKFFASMITNGTLLEERTIKELSLLGMRRVQITLDGPPAVHDKARPFKNGQGSFEVIEENAKKASKYLLINIRVNIDRRFSKFEAAFLEHLRSWSKNIRIGVSPVRYDHDGRFCEMDRNREYIFRTFGYGFRNPKLNARIAGCGANRIKPSVIDTNGDLYRCWHEIGSDSEPVGNIAERSQSIGKKEVMSHLRWNSFNPYRTLPCMDCKLLPSCAGGCPEQHLSNGRNRCEMTEEQFIDYLGFNIDKY